MIAQQERHKLGNGYFTISDIAEILNVQRNKISYLVREYWNDKLSRNKDFDYLIAKEGSLALNFLALIEINIFHILREEGIGYGKALEAHGFLSKELGTNYPFAHHAFYRSGSDILFEKKNCLIQAKTSQQIAIRGIVAPFSQKIEYNTQDIAMAYYPLGKERAIVINPEHQFGAPVIQNTNIMASTLAEMYKAGDSVRLISNIYAIPEAAVQDAIAYFKQAA